MISFDVKNEAQSKPKTIYKNIKKVLEAKNLK